MNNADPMQRLANIPKIEVPSNEEVDRLALKYKPLIEAAGYRVDAVGFYVDDQSERAPRWVRILSALQHTLGELGYWWWRGGVTWCATNSNWVPPIRGLSGRLDSRTAAIFAAADHAMAELLKQQEPEGWEAKLSRARRDKPVTAADLLATIDLMRTELRRERRLMTHIRDLGKKDVLRKELDNAQ